MDTIYFIGGLLLLVGIYFFLKKFGEFLLSLAIAILGVAGIIASFRGAGWGWGVAGLAAALICGSNVVRSLKTGEYNMQDTARRMYIEQEREKYRQETDSD